MIPGGGCGRAQDSADMGDDVLVERRDQSYHLPTWAAESSAILDCPLHTTNLLPMLKLAAPRGTLVTERLAGSLSEALRKEMDCAGSEVGTLPDEVHVTPDGGVLKSVVRQGSNDDLCPSLHSRCLVHYKGVIADTGETFMDTRQEAAAPATVVAGRVTSEVGTGLSAALMHMRRGEVARVRCSAQYGYGSKGNFSFPSVPPNAALIYEVELLSWEEADDSMEDPREVVFFEDKVEAAERRRQQGNDLYRAGNVVGALSKYAMVRPAESVAQDMFACSAAMPFLTCT